MASAPIGTSRCLSPFPMTLMKPTSRYRQLILRLTTSLTRSPQLYMVSNIALFLPPSGTLKSIAEIIFSISSKDKVSGKSLFNFGASSNTVGSFSEICSSKQYL